MHDDYEGVDPVQTGETSLVRAIAKLSARRIQVAYRSPRRRECNTGISGAEALCIIPLLIRRVTTINDKLRLLLEAVANGGVDVEAALASLRHLPYEDLDFAKIDHHRELRDGLPEVILGLGKTPAQVAAIGEKLVERSGRLLVTRLDREGYRALQAAVPDAEYHEMARVAIVDREPRPLLGGVLVVCAGTSDLPVAQEASLTARMLGSEAKVISDVGVAGIHRLFDQLETITQANALVVVAGMEGRCPAWSPASYRRRSSPCPRRSDTARASRAWRRCWRCSTAARPASPSSISITALGRATWRRRSTPWSTAGVTTSAAPMRQ